MMRMLQKAAMALHAAVYRASGGRVFGGFGKTKFLLLHTTGRKSGQDRVAPLNYVTDGDAYVIIASNGGAARHPDWFLNIEAKPDAEEVNGKRLKVRATVADEAERERLWPVAVASWGAYNSYQKKTERTIPVVRLDPVG
jgi:deazaflavin-dependent oxidoreductase (nitroreductase family)